MPYIGIKYAWKTPAATTVS